jgi:hypothetical protein
MLTFSRGWRFTLIAALATAALVGKRTARADDASEDKAEVSQRCAVRLAIALTGKSADSTLLSSSAAGADPQTSVDDMVKSPEFADRYARFVNSQFNGGPIAAANDDPIYYLAKHVISNGLAWSDLFQGSFSITPAATATDGMEIGDDQDGLGYFHSDSWKKRYAGNEDNGIMLVAAFRYVQNTTGLDLTPSIGQPGDDRTVTGRQASPCKSCHFDSWFAIDTVASLLPTRKGQGDTMTFTPPSGDPVNLLGKSIADDRELVQTLVTSDGFKFNQCRMVFKFLYGRAENQCEAKTFDACVSALETTKTIQSAVAAVAKDASFCTN